jgi:hypothetical protein
MLSIDRPLQWVGRTQELAILCTAAAALRGGEGAVVWVSVVAGLLKHNW